MRTLGSVILALLLLAAETAAVGLIVLAPWMLVRRRAR